MVDCSKETIFSNILFDCNRTTTSLSRISKLPQKLISNCVFMYSTSCVIHKPYGRLLLLAAVTVFEAGNLSEFSGMLLQLSVSWQLTLQLRLLKMPLPTCSHRQLIIALMKNNLFLHCNRTHKGQGPWEEQDTKI